MLSAVTPELPDPPHPHIRGIFEQERLREILSKLGVSTLKLDSVLEGFSNTVCKKPELFEREPCTGWSRVIVKAYPPEVPPMRVWFTYDDNNVYVEHVELLEG